MVLGFSVTLIRVLDVDREARFYREWLGLEPRRFESGRIATFHVPNGPELELAAGGTIQPAVDDRMKIPAIPIFHVDDVEGMAASAADHGGSIVNAPFKIREATLAYVADPEGHVIGLSSRNQTSQP